MYCLLRRTPQSIHYIQVHPRNHHGFRIRLAPLHVHNVHGQSRWQQSVVLRSYYGPPDAQTHALDPSSDHASGSSAAPSLLVQAPWITYNPQGAGRPVAVHKSAH